MANVNFMPLITATMPNRGDRPLVEQKMKSVRFVK